MTVPYYVVLTNALKHTAFILSEPIHHLHGINYCLLGNLHSTGIFKNFQCEMKFSCKKFSQTLPVSENFPSRIVAVRMLAADKNYPIYGTTIVYIALSLRVSGEPMAPSLWLGHPPAL